jgi:DNA polymerase-4
MIGELAAWPEADRVRRFGKYGHALARHARGIDDRPLELDRVAKSVSQEGTFARDQTSRGVLLKTIIAQTAQVSAALRRKHMPGTTVTLKLRWSDFTTVTCQVTLKQPTDAAEDIASAATRLLDALLAVRRPVRLIGVGMSGLQQPLPRQPSLWEVEQVQATADKAERIAAALNRVRERFGDAAVRSGKDLLSP